MALYANRPFSKTAAENSNKQSSSISGVIISAEKKYGEKWKIYRGLYDWGYDVYPQSYKRL